MSLSIVGSLSSLAGRASSSLTIPRLPSIPTFPSIPGLPSIPSLSNVQSFPATNQGPTSAVDVVGVFDDSYNQLFDLARPIKCTVNPSSKLMDHPVEDGSTITDFRIVLPIELELSLICTSVEYRSVYQQIKTAFLGGATVIVKTRADTYLNMMIQSMPHDETMDMFDAIPVSVKLREVIFVTTQFQSLPPEQVQNKNDQSTVKKGEVQPKETVALSAFNGAKDLLKKAFSN